MAVVRQRRRARRAQPARAGGRGGRRMLDGNRRLDIARVAGHHPAAHAALRQVRRRALQHHLGASQVDAQQRSGRRRVLARAHGRSRRGPAVHRAPARPLRVRRHRQRRPAGARPSRWPPRRPSISSACPRATRRWRRPRSTWRRRPRATPSTTAYNRAAEDAHDDVARAGAAAPAKRADEADEGARTTARATATRTTKPTPSPTCRACRRRSKDGSTTSRRTGASKRKSNDGWMDGKTIKKRRRETT